jgi:hypothetical protein
MKDRGKPHTNKYSEIMNDWNYEARCMLTSLLVWGFVNCKLLILVAQSVLYLTHLLNSITQIQGE